MTSNDGLLVLFFVSMERGDNYLSSSTKELEALQQKARERVVSVDVAQVDEGKISTAMHSFSPERIFNGGEDMKGVFLHFGGGGGGWGWEGVWWWLGAETP